MHFQSLQRFTCNDSMLLEHALITFHEAVDPRFPELRLPVTFDLHGACPTSLQDLLNALHGIFLARAHVVCTFALTPDTHYFCAGWLQQLTPFSAVAGDGLTLTVAALA